ncbi:hypothetical protein FRC08_016438, partial [Ceratobasidium sp. 394]
MVLWFILFLLLHVTAKPNLRIYMTLLPALYCNVCTALRVFITCKAATPRPTMSSPKFTVSHKAYTKVIVHAAKYPHAPVNGVLIGRPTPSDGGSIVVEDAIPLLHQWTSLSPMMEIGLDLARTHAESMGMELLGYYQATQRLDDDEGLSAVGQRIASNLKDKFKDAFAVA